MPSGWKAPSPTLAGSFGSLDNRQAPTTGWAAVASWAAARPTRLPRPRAAPTAATRPRAVRRLRPDNGERDGRFMLDLLAPCAAVDERRRAARRRTWGW